MILFYSEMAQESVIKCMNLSARLHFEGEWDTDTYYKGKATIKHIEEARVDAVMRTGDRWRGEREKSELREQAGGTSMGNARHAKKRAVGFSTGTPRDPHTGRRRLRGRVYSAARAPLPRRESLFPQTFCPPLGTTQRCRIGQPHPVASCCAPNALCFTCFNRVHFQLDLSGPIFLESPRENVRHLKPSVPS